MNKEFRVFELETGHTSLCTTFKMNCHKCGKTFSPLKVYMHPTNTKDYYLGTYCRLFLIIFLEEVALCSCLRKALKDIHILDNVTGETKELPYTQTWVYDCKDDMEGKINNEAG